jgi:hypothetical protein
MVLCCYTPGKSRTLFRRFGTLRSAVVSRRDDTNMLLDQTKPAEDVDDHYQQTFAAQMDGLAGFVRINSKSDIRYSAYTDDYAESFRLPWSRW